MIGRDFSDLVLRTKCPFARSARILAAPEWESSLSLDENAVQHAAALADFARRIETERLHGFVAEVRTLPSQPSFEQVRVGFRNYLFALAKTDASCGASMSEIRLDKDWQFAHSEVRFFLNVFSSCYPIQHSKYCRGSHGFYVFFQPERSFDFCGSRPLSEFKYEIRRRFEAAGMPYNGDQIDRRLEALLYMFPVDPDGAPVVWWD